MADNTELLPFEITAHETRVLQKAVWHMQAGMVVDEDRPVLQALSVALEEQTQAYSEAAP